MSSLSAGVTSSGGGGRAPRKRGKSLAVDDPNDLHHLDAYTLGDTFTQEEQDYLFPLIASLNSAIVEYLSRASELSIAKGISVGPSSNGGGLFSAKSVSDGIAAVYYGTLEVKTRYTGRRDYAVELDSLQLMPRGPKWKIILCGYERRSSPLNAVMINHACMDARINVRLEQCPVTVYADPEARRTKIQKEQIYQRISPSLSARADEVLFSYVVVVARIIKPVAPGEELLTSYNRVDGGGDDEKDDYFMSRDVANRVKKAGEVLVACACEPGGCPMGRFFLLDRRLVAAGPVGK
jgi:hypothetical protein